MEDQTKQETIKQNQVTVFNHQLSPLSMYYCTTESMENAKQISQSLVEKKLAACVNILGQGESSVITSVYFWDSKVNTDPEYLLIIKSRTELLQEIVDEIKKIHTYKVPEIIGTPIFGGSKAYLDWVFENTKEPIKL
ncbi:hypothetical protein ABPG72_019625 [Tetrahymena utriculariae]